MKKLITMLLVVCLMASLGIAAFAVDPTTATTPTEATTPTQATTPTEATTPTQATTPTEATTPSTPETPFPFEDVGEKYWGRPAIAWAFEKGITDGVTETLFAPEAECTRAQVVTFLWRAEGKKAPTIALKDCPFKDLKEGEYYVDAVLWAFENKITDGTDVDKFSPDDTVTRAQFVTLLARNAKMDKVVTETPFKDVDVKAYYAGAVKWAAENGITDGRDEGIFAPNEPCKRAEVVTFLYRFYEAPLKADAPASETPAPDAPAA